MLYINHSGKHIEINFNMKIPFSPKSGKCIRSGKAVQALTHQCKSVSSVVYVKVYRPWMAGQLLPREMNVPDSVGPWPKATKYFN